MYPMEWNVSTEIYGMEFIYEINGMEWNMWTRMYEMKCME